MPADKSYLYGLGDKLRILREAKHLKQSQVAKYLGISTTAVSEYESEIKTAVLGDRTITVKNLTPVFSPQELEKHNREIERRLFEVFRKYAGQRG